MRCVVGKCNLPEVMHTGTDSLAVCGGHAYGVVVPEDAAAECDGHFAVDGADDTAQGAAKAGLMVSVDGTEGCAGVLATGSKDGAATPQHMAVWLR